MSLPNETAGMNANSANTDILRPSRAASLGAVASVLGIAVGLAGQLLGGSNVAFAMVAGLGLAALAAIVVAHER